MKTMNKILSIFKSIFRNNKDGIEIKYGAKVFSHACVKATRGGSINMGKVLVNDNAFVCASGGKIVVDDNVTINRNVVIVAKNSIIIGSGSSIGPNTCIYDHNHKIDKDGFYKDEFSSTPVTIGRNVWIAANCTILKGTTIGDNSIIGAGCVVSVDVPCNTMVKSDRNLQFIPLHD